MIPTVALLLKAPISGYVKTRLAREIGADAARDVYERLVRHQIERIPSDWNVVVHFAPADALERMTTFLGDHPTYVPQPDGDLGDRLRHATTHHFEINPSAPLLLIGGDCPYLDRRLLETCASSLVHRDVCLVPALDGGYVLVGLRSNQPAVFTDISWSTPRVYLETTRQCLAAGLTLRAIEPALEDIDHLPAWQRALASGTMRTPTPADSTTAPTPPESSATAAR